MNKETIGRLYSPIKLNKKYLLHPVRAMEKLEQIHQQWVLLKERFIEQQYWWMVERFRPGTTVLDLGANMGDSAIYFAQFKEVKKVIAYEPSPFAYDQMVANIGMGPFGDKIVARNMAVSNNMRELIVSPDRKNVIGFNAEQPEDSRGKRIRAITLDEALAAVPARIAIKCDIEGAEETLFDSSDMRKVYMVMLEWHGYARRAGARKGLTKNGFRIVKDIGTRGHGGLMCAEKC